MDIILGVPSFKNLKQYIKELKKLGYQHHGEKGIRGRHFFTKGREAKRTHHLHFVKKHTRLWEKHVLFRDYLRSHKNTCIEYDVLKQELAKTFPKDRDAYTKGKEWFIKNVIKNAERK